MFSQFIVSVLFSILSSLFPLYAIFTHSQSDALWPRKQKARHIFKNTILRSRLNHVFFFFFLIFSNRKNEQPHVFLPTWSWEGTKGWVKVPLTASYEPDKNLCDLPDNLNDKTSLLQQGPSYWTSCKRSLTALWSYKRWHSVGEEWEVFSSLDGAIKWCEEKKKVSFCFLGSNLETDKQNFKRHKISWRKDHCENVFSLLGERFEFQDFLF